MKATLAVADYGDDDAQTLEFGRLHRLSQRQITEAVQMQQQEQHQL